MSNAAVGILCSSWCKGLQVVVQQIANPLDAHVSCRVGCQILCIQSLVSLPHEDGRHPQPPDRNAIVIQQRVVDIEQENDFGGNRTFGSFPSHEFMDESLMS
jgi:hypothetical protein